MLDYAEIWYCDGWSGKRIRKVHQIKSGKGTFYRGIEKKYGKYTRGFFSEWGWAKLRWSKVKQAQKSEYT